MFAILNQIVKNRSFGITFFRNCNLKNLENQHFQIIGKKKCVFF